MHWLREGGANWTRKRESLPGQARSRWLEPAEGLLSCLHLKLTPPKGGSLYLGPQGDVQKSHLQLLRKLSVVVSNDTFRFKWLRLLLARDGVSRASRSQVVAWLEVGLSKQHVPGTVLKSRVIE